MFFVEEKNIREKEIWMTNPEEIHHLIKVKRGKLKEIIRVSDGKKFEYKCGISEIKKNEIKLDIIEKKPLQGESDFNIHLFQGNPKAGKLDLIIQKTTELGISHITPVITERSINKDKGEKKGERYEKIALAAAKQAERGRVPEVHPTLTFAETMEIASESGLKILFYENEKETTFKSVLKAYKNENPNISVWVGPEGGFSEKEIEVAKQAGVKTVSLGKRILRTETVAMTAVSIMLYELDS